MKYQERCECCDSVLTAYTHPINKSMVAGLIKLAKKYLSNGFRPVNINQDIDLDHNQKCNVPKFQHYGFLFKRPDGWVLTEVGRLWLEDKISIAYPAASMGNKTLPPGHPAWSTHKTSRTQKRITEIADHAYKHVDEYQAEKSPQSSMF